LQRPGQKPTALGLRPQGRSRARQGNKWQPTPLFKVPLGTLRSDIEQYATNDGKRFLFLKPVDRRPRPINGVINWPMAIKAHNQP